MLVPIQEITLIHRETILDSVEAVAIVNSIEGGLKELGNVNQSSLDGQSQNVFDDYRKVNLSPRNDLKGSIVSFVGDETSLYD